MEKSTLKTFKINQSDYFNYPLTNETQEGYKELIQTIQRKLDIMDTENVTHFLQEVFEDNFVYEIRGGDNSGFYKRTYSNTNGQIEFTGDPVAVRRKTEFVVQEIQDIIDQKKLQANKIQQEIKLYPGGINL